VFKNFSGLLKWLYKLHCALGVQLLPRNFLPDKLLDWLRNSILALLPVSTTQRQLSVGTQLPLKQRSYRGGREREDRG
jgi:hypothetical protein